MSPLQEAEAFYRGVLGAEAHLPEALLLRVVQGQMTALEKARVEAHLMACSRCQRDVQALYLVAQPAAATAAPTPPAPTAEPAALDTPAHTPSPVARAPKRPSLPALPALRSPVLPLLFLAVNALGLGGIYSAVTRRSSTPRPTPAPVVTASPAPTEDLNRFRAAYEAQLSLERGRVAQLEKQVETLKQLPKTVASPSPTGSTTVRLKPEAIRVPILTQRAVSLSARPAIVWKPTPKATSYSVELLSASGKRVEKAVVRKTEWRTTKTLKRGTTYRWRVTALGKTKKPLGAAQVGGVTVMAKGEAGRLANLLTQLADELSRLGFRTEAAAARARAANLR